MQKWLEQAQVVGKEKIHTVRLKQEARLRLEKDKPWMIAEAQQYFTVDEPGFIWKAKIKAAPFFHIAGRDKHFQGLKEYKDFAGLLVPSKGTITRELSSGDFEWFQFTVTELEYNVPQVYYSVKAGVCPRGTRRLCPVWPATRGYFGGGRPCPVPDIEQGIALLLFPTAPEERTIPCSALCYASFLRGCPKVQTKSSYSLEERGWPCWSFIPNLNHTKT